MCGINGFNWNEGKLVNSMNKAIRHRGPDDQGSYTDDKVSLGQVRLSIIDLSEKGHQPMGLQVEKKKTRLIYKDEELKDADIIIVFNGEIYNFQEIRKNLKEFRFESTSDTEVILKAYLKWGFDCVKKFNGMWAFCIYDKKKKIFFCSRDRLGVKPFYYCIRDGKFIFSSEIKAILAHKSLKINTKNNVNEKAVELYFSLGFVPAPLSIYKDIYKLEGRQNLIFNLQTKGVERKWHYYNIPEYNPVYDKKKLIEEGRRLLYDATRLRLIADVPVGAFLSGGLDSSSIVGAMSKFVDLKNLHTFSIGFEGKYDESYYIKIVKDYFKTRHHHYFFKEKDFQSLIDTFAYFYDEPFWDYSGFPTYKVSEMARNYVTVALSGDGGDEIFGGYNTHLLGSRMDLIYNLPKFIRKLGYKIPAKKNLGGLASIYLLKQAFKLSLDDKKYFYAKALEDEGFKPESYKKWTTERLEFSLKKGDNSLAEALRIHDLLFNTLQDNFLVKVDRASMAHALEVRSPFLDYRFIEFSQKIPTEWKVNTRMTKILMRKIIKGIVPKEIVFRGKQGFTPPIDRWILNVKYHKSLEESCILLEQINKRLYDFYCTKVFKENNKLYTSYKIRLFLFAEWWKKWIGE